MLLKCCAVLLLLSEFVSLSTGYFHPSISNNRLKISSHLEVGTAARYPRSSGQHTNPSPIVKKDFYIRNKLATFWEAIQHCIDEGKRLASVQSEGETKRLLELIGHSKEKFWIAGTDIGRENRWMWLNRGEMLRYTKWLPAQPDNWKGSEHCLEFDAHANGQWNDYNCEKCNHYICEDTDKKKDGKH